MKNTRASSTSNGSDVEDPRAVLEETHTLIKKFAQLYNMQNFNDAANLTIWREEKLKELFDRLGKMQLAVLKVEEKASVRITTVSLGYKGHFLRSYLLLYKYPEGWLISNLFRDYRKVLKCTRRWSPAAIEKLQNYAKSDLCKDLSFLSAIAREKSIILLGETHYAEQIYTTMHLVTQVLHQWGYTNLIMEKPSSLEYYCSKYLQTGDNNYYRYTLDEGNLLKNLWEYSRNLPSSEQFKAWCVDTELIPLLVFVRLEEYLQRLAKVCPVKSVQERLSLWVNNADISPEVLKNIDELMKERKSLIPEDMADEYVKICEWIKELRVVSEKKMKREDIMKRRVVQILEELTKSTPNPKIVGWFGAEHAAKKRIDRQLPESLGEFLSHRYSRTKGRVYSLRLLPYRGEVYTSINNNKKMSIWPVKYSIEDLLASTIEGDLLFLDLEPLRDYWFYDNMMNWINYAYYDGILFHRDVTCAARTI